MAQDDVQDAADQTERTTAPPTRERSPVRVLGIAVAMLLVATVGWWVWRANRDACLTIPIELATRPPDTQPWEPSDVLVYHSVGNAMSGAGSSMLVADSGDAIVTTTRPVSAPPVVRRARLSADTVDGLRRCLSGPGFQHWATDYPSTGTTPKGGFCAMADLSDFTIASGPASGKQRKASAPIVPPGDHGCTIPDKPDTLVTLEATLEDISHAVTAQGVPADEPPSKLIPR